jgi:hypothetical protein
MGSFPFSVSTRGSTKPIRLPHEIRVIYFRSKIEQAKRKAAGLPESSRSVHAAQVLGGSSMRFLLLLSIGMLVALLVKGVASMVTDDKCPELARAFAPGSCPTQGSLPGGLVRIAQTYRPAP